MISLHVAVWGTSGAAVRGREAALEGSNWMITYSVFWLFFEAIFVTYSVSFELFPGNLVSNFEKTSKKACGSVIED